MFVLKKKYEAMSNEMELYKGVAENRLNKINELEKSLRISRSELSNVKAYAERMQLNNCKFNTEKIKDSKIIEQLENANHELHQEQQHLKEELEKHKIAVDDLGKVYNSMNRKLWANHEAQRQLRILAEDILEADKINKASLSKYLYDLSMLIGGGENFEYVGLKEVLEKGETEAVG